MESEFYSFSTIARIYSSMKIKSLKSFYASWSTSANLSKFWLSVEKNWLEWIRWYPVTCSWINKVMKMQLSCSKSRTPLESTGSFTSRKLPCFLRRLTAKRNWAEPPRRKYRSVEEQHTSKHCRRKGKRETLKSPYQKVWRLRSLSLGPSVISRHLERLKE